MNDKSIPYFQFLLFVISIVSILIILVDFTIVLDLEISSIIQYADFIICFIFFCDFMYNIITAESKLRYLKWGWLDLISSIPMIDALRFGRLVRILKVVKIFRLIKFGKLLYTYVGEHRGRNVLLSSLFMSIFLIFIGSVAILIAEVGAPGANILLAEDAIWWSVSTITTVGYGDFYPITLMGRLVAVVLLVGGISIFGIFTGSIASWFVKE